jgi:hypothetical protein
MSGICLTSVIKSFGSIFEMFMKNKIEDQFVEEISENDPAYQFLQITTSVSLYLKVYFLAISVVKVVRNFENDCSPGTPIFSTNKTDRHDITEILLILELNTINHNKPTTDIIYY